MEKLSLEVWTNVYPEQNKFDFLWWNNSKDIEYIMNTFSLLFAQLAAQLKCVLSVRYWISTNATGIVVIIVSQ